MNYKGHENLRDRLNSQCIPQCIVLHTRALGTRLLGFIFKVLEDDNGLMEFAVVDTAFSE